MRGFIATVVIILAYFISKYARLNLERMLSKFGLGFARRIAELVRYFILFIGAVAALSVLSLEMTALSVIMVLILILFLVSVRDIVLNLASELYLVMRKPFKNNDQVKVGDIEGTVRSIRAMDTEIITYDGDLVIVPNSYFLKHPIINKSQSIVRHIELKIVFHRKELEEIERAIKEVLMEIKPELFGEPELLSVSKKGDKVEALISIPIVNVRKLRWLTAKITKGFFTRGIEVEIE
ncbi:mechanosensitive ion channel [Candidatus Bathyarchaeota archaeon]|nr:mechanosensitive ion channel [Candidatus Bathyarchaeota archaeon]